MSNNQTNSYKTISVAQLKDARATAKQRRKDDKKSMTSALGAPDRKVKTSDLSNLAQSMILATGNLGRNKEAFQAIMAAHVARANEPEFINPRSGWTWDQRFAVKMVKPAVSITNPSKAELVAALSPFQATAHTFRTAGFDREYSYNPNFTHPYGPAWPYFARGLDPVPTSRDALMAASKWVFVPPSPSSMVAKTVKNLSADVPPCPPELWKSMHEAYKLRPVPEMFTFPKLPADRKGWLAQTVDDVVEWLTHDAAPKLDGHFSDEVPYPLKGTSPGLPWIIMKTPEGRSYGDGHSQAMMEAAVLSERSVLRRFLTALLSTYLKKFQTIWGIGKGSDAKPTTSPEAARLATIALGRQCYTAAVASTAPAMDIGGHDFKTFQMHLMYNQMAGNVKPVTYDDLEAGKPDRSVYSTPYLLRLLTTRLSHISYDALQCDYAIKSFKWVEGGAEAMMGHIEDKLDARTWVTGPGPEHLHAVENEDCVFLNPDVKAMDMHVHASYVEDFHRHDVSGMFVFNKPGQMHQALINMIIGVSEGSIAEPVVLFNNGTFYRPRHLNTSGNAFVYLVNQKAVGSISVLLRGETGYEKYNEYALNRFGRVMHVAWGDDMLIGLKLPPATDVLGNKIPVNKRLSNGDYDPNAKLPVSLRTLWQGDGDAPGKIPKKIKKLLGFELKPETLHIHRSLTGAEILGHNVWATTEFGEPQFLAARPLEKVIFSVMWPKHFQGTGSPITPAIYAALRCAGAFLEAALAYPSIRQPLREIYAHAVRSSTAVNWRDARIADQFELEVGSPYMWGTGVRPAEVLGKLETGFSLGRFPSLEAVWELQTGLPYPRAISEVAEVSEGSEEVDLEALAGLIPEDFDEELEPEFDQEPESEADAAPMDPLAGLDQ